MTHLIDYNTLVNALFLGRWVKTAPTLSGNLRPAQRRYAAVSGPVNANLPGWVFLFDGEAQS